MRRFLLAIALSAPALTAQQKFDVASVKVNESGSGPSSTRLTPGHVAMNNVSLKKAVLMANGIPDDREYALAGPDFLTSVHIDVEATFAATAAPQQVREMLQAMLTDRFKLTLHKETRLLPMYSLVAAKGGVKIHPAEGSEGGGTSGGDGHFSATKISMAHFVDLLAKRAGLPVTDATGLHGVYSFTLDWSPEADLRLKAGDGEPGAGGASIFTALQEQLGLKLESGKGPVEVLVVDRVEKAPSAN